LDEIRARVPVPTTGVLSVRFLRVLPKRAHTWHEDKVIVEVAFAVRVRNEGLKAIPRWEIGAEVDWTDTGVEQRLVNNDAFPGLWRRGGIRLDSTLLSGRYMDDEHAIGVWIRRSDPFGETFKRTLNATTLTFWPITDEGPGERKTVNLSDHIDWEKQLPGFREAHLLTVGRLEHLD
jgi:hypothetical protein